MARTNSAVTRVKPEAVGLMTLFVRRSARISPSFIRVTLGGDDLASFEALGFDQWFRLFIPVADNSLPRLPNKLDTISYLRYLTISKTERPALRNYTVRGFRAVGADGPELDVDFVVHGSAADGTSGLAATWAQTCQPGDVVAILDEGLTYNPPAELVGTVILAADETGLPAAAGILTSLPRDTIGHAVLEIPDAADQQQIEAPVGIDVTWVVREDAQATPGVTALAAAIAIPVSPGGIYAWAAGEQSLPTSLRRHWVKSGVPKNAINFCGYWKAAAHR